MLINPARLEYVNVPDFGQIGAGTVVPFQPRGRVRIPRPRNARSGDVLVSYLVCGDSLEGDKIFDGFRLNCRANFELAEIKNSKIVVVKLPCGDLVAKHFYLLENGKIKLSASNPKYESGYYDLDMIEIKALVLEAVLTVD